MLYENSLGTHYQYSYSPWGVRTYLTGDTIHFCQPGEEPIIAPFYRTYTGHEDLWMFGLLNANARLYSPYLGRFISPDPLLNEDGGPLDYNPYIYARNNPYRYIDRNGEFFGILLWGAIFGGGANVMANFDNINCAGDFFGYFGVGAAAGAITAGVTIGVTPLIVGAMGGAGLGCFSGAAICGVAGATSYLAQNGLNSAFLGMPFEFSWKDFALQVGISAALGGITGYFSAKANGLNPWSGKAQMSPIPHRPLMTEPDALSSKSNPASYESNVTRISPNMKGKMGVQRAMGEIIDEGGTILGTEVTIEVDGIRIRPDIIYRGKDGMLTFVEVKNGHYARPTPNQKIAIPLMRQEHPVIIPKGGNAARIPDFNNIMINNQPYTGNYQIRVIHYPE